MKWFRGAFIAVRPRMLNRRVKRAGNILNQRAAEKNIHALNAVADCKDGFAFSEGVFEKRKIGAFAVRVSFGGRRISRSYRRARDSRLRGYR